MTTASADIQVRVELGSALAPLRENPYVLQLERSISADIEVLLERLGLEGNPEVEVVSVESLRPLRIRVNGQTQSYSPNLMLRAWLAVAPAEDGNAPAAAPGSTDGFPAAWVQQYAAVLAGRSEPGYGVLIAFVERLAQQAILKRPSCLLGPAQLSAYARRSGAPEDELQVVLPRLLDLGVSVADAELIADLLREGQEYRRSLEDTVEALFIDLFTHTVEVHVHPTTLQAVFPTSPVDERFSVYSTFVDEHRKGLFEYMERAFFSTYGFILPRLVWVPSAFQPPGTFSVRVAAWWGLPTPMIEPGERLVSVPHEFLHEIHARPTLDPTSGLLCATISDEDRAAVEAAGFQTSGPIDFVILNVLAELSRRPSQLLAIEDVEYLLAQLADAEFHGLVDAALARHSLGDLTRLFRSLVDGRLSLRDLPTILEALVQFDTLELDAEELDVLDTRLPVRSEALLDGSARSRALYAYVRRQLKPYLSHIYSWQDGAAFAYALEPELERRLRHPGRDPLTEAEIEEVRDCVWAKLLTLSSGRFGHIVLTASDTREAVRELLVPEFPDLPVVARSELDPRLPVEIVDVIPAPRKTSAQRGTSQDAPQPARRRQR